MDVAIYAASASISAITLSCMRECVDIATVTYAAAHQYNIISRSRILSISYNKLKSMQYYYNFNK